MRQRINQFPFPGLKIAFFEPPSPFPLELNCKKLANDYYFLWVRGKEGVCLPAEAFLSPGEENACHIMLSLNHHVIINRDEGNFSF